MTNEVSHAAIAGQIKDVVLLLEDHDLEQAESGGQALYAGLQPAAPATAAARKLKNLRQCLESGIRHIQRAAPLSALVRFREALRNWLA